MEKAIPFKLRNRSDINFDITDGDNKPVCIDKEYLPSDYEEGIRTAGSVYRFVLPGRDVEDFVEDVCYILGEIYDEGEVLSREELRNAFKDGFDLPPVFFTCPKTDVTLSVPYPFMTADTDLSRKRYCKMGR